MRSNLGGASPLLSTSTCPNATTSRVVSTRDIAVQSVDKGLADLEKLSESNHLLLPFHVGPPPALLWCLTAEQTAN